MQTMIYSYPLGDAIEIQADPFSYVGLSQGNELISSGTVEESGFVVLVFDPINDVTNLDITITGQNKIPHFNEIFVASPDGAFTSLSSQSCLLYTSPSPRDRTSCRMPSSA